MRNTQTKDRTHGTNLRSRSGRGRAIGFFERWLVFLGDAEMVLVGRAVFFDV
jgi:hypothetical protein